MPRRASRMSLLDAKHAGIRENPTAEELLAAVGEKCMMQSVLTAVFPLRYPLNQETTDQYTAVTATRPEGNPQARIS